MNTITCQADMTEQVEAIERRNAEFNRALSDYYTRHQTWPACCGDCEQGRKVCATPEACRQPETQTWFDSQEDALAVWFGMRNAAIYLAIASLAVWGLYELADVLWGWL